MKIKKKTQLKLALAIIGFMAISAGLFYFGRQMRQSKEPADITPAIINTRASDATDYFPLTVGDEWRYKTQQGGKAAPDLIIQIINQEIIDGKTIYISDYKMEDGFSVQKQYYEKTGNAVLMRQQNDFVYDPPKSLLELPLAAGRNWRWDIAQGGSPITFEYKVIAEEKVEVPAGEFLAWKVRVDAKDAQGTAQPPSWRWFAPGVGLIKEEGAFTIGADEAAFSAELAEYHLK